MIIAPARPSNRHSGRTRSVVRHLVAHHTWLVLSFPALPLHNHKQILYQRRQVEEDLPCQRTFWTW